MYLINTTGLVHISLYVEVIYGLQKAPYSKIKSFQDETKILIMNLPHA